MEEPATAEGLPSTMAPDDGSDYSSPLPLAVITPNSAPIANPSSLKLRVKSVIRPDGSRTDKILTLDVGKTDECELAIVSPTRTAATRIFTLPDGWVVKKKYRRYGGAYDKYYHDPETGNKFRSLREVERYINGEEYKPARNKGPRVYHRIMNTAKRKEINSDRKMMELQDEESNQYQLVIVSHTPVSSTRAFTLPDGWVVEEVPRRSGGYVDKYYYEPETGKKFRSRREVERYINGEDYTPSKSQAIRQYQHVENNGKQKMVISGGKMLTYQNQSAVSSPSVTSLSSVDLPDGWVVEKVPRRSGNAIDTYYYEPETGRQFRSLISVKKHLAELEENLPLSVTLAEMKAKDKSKSDVSSPLSELKDNVLQEDREENSPLSVALAELREDNTPLSKAFKLRIHMKNSNLLKKSISKKRHTSMLLSPPSKINWVIASAGGNAWNAFVNDSLVPESVKRQWDKRFMSTIRGGHDEPNAGTNAGWFCTFMDAQKSILLVDFDSVGLEAKGDAP